MLPFAIFVIAILLFQDDRNCLWLIKAIVMPGVALAVVGLIQFELFPDMLLFEKKHFYLQSLTVVFVNSNTAATYLAMLLVFSIGLAFHSIQNAGFRHLLRCVIGAPSTTRLADARGGAGRHGRPIALLSAVNPDRRGSHCCRNGIYCTIHGRIAGKSDIPRS